MPLFRSILNLGRWRGAKPNVLVNGRIDARIESVGASLVGLKSVQGGYHSQPKSGLSNLDTGTITIAQVDINKTILISRDSTYLLFRLVGSTSLQWTYFSGSGSSSVGNRYLLVEFY